MSEAFHGSFSPSIHTFKAFTHFGTRDAALQTLARKENEGKYGTFCLYKVEILVPKRSLLCLSDWGTPSPIGLAMQLRDEARATRRSYFEAFRAELTRRKNARLDFIEFGWSWLRSYLQSQQKRGLSYSNIVEESKGGDSWCIMNSKDIHIVSRRLVLSEEVSKASARRMS